MPQAIELFPKVARRPESHDLHQETPGSIATMNDSKIGKHQSPAGLNRFRFADKIPIQAGFHEIAGEALFYPAVVLPRRLTAGNGIVGIQMDSYLPSAKHAARDKTETLAP